MKSLYLLLNQTLMANVYIYDTIAIAAGILPYRRM